MMINYNHSVVVFLLLSLGIFKLGLCTENQSQKNNVTVKCIQSEREALVSFKTGVIDFPGKLSSWVGEDCCKWKGVECDNESSHVTKLNLSNPAGRHRHYEYDRNDDNYPIPSDHSTLDPSTPRYNTLPKCEYCRNAGMPRKTYSRGSNVKAFVAASFSRDVKTSVKASFSGEVNKSLSGEISPYLGNLSSLTHLDVEGNYNLFTKNLDWLSSLSSLEYLYMGGVKINHTKADWLHAINMLPSLLELSLCSCQLEHLPSSLNFLNFTSLHVLDLSYNSFKTSIPQWLFNLTNLTKLDLTSSNQGGKILDSFGRLGSLKYLYLGVNHFYGSIPASIGNLSSLKELDLSYNEMNGTILESFGQLSKLVNLYLLENSWEGVITEVQLMNLKSLEEFMLTSKSQSLVFNVTENWVPPFSLKSLHLESCRIIGPKFPKWLQVQSKLTYVTLRNVGIEGTIPEEWISTISSQLTHLDLSNNQIEGNLPQQLVFPNVTKLFLQNNSFSGPIPSNISDLMPSLQYLDLSENHLYDLAENNLSGGIPDCFNNLIALVDHNTFGYEPIENYTEKAFIVTKGRAYEYDRTLQLVTCIDLSGNSLTGGIPIQITSLTRLGMLNLSMNHLNGSIPENIGNMRWLETLDLSNNRILGSIPGSLSFLTSLVHLNLSFNNLSGRIPSGNQLQTLIDATIYKGNPSLCGSPLPTKCPGDEASDGPSITGVDDKQGGDDYERIWFYASIGLGFGVGFWSVCGTLLLKKSWRHCYFRFCDDIKDRIALLIALRVVHLKRKFGLEKN
ncbi:hypothetical protein SO802_005598 [Lithocarpus litseifolius]|uniref:Leucine-rich repeat-containing N-terminal plant-type domain-containing protein n=1 Tax=Lithocarpus litseifolius TaxID=425828 RepID=A0AAW2DMG2_9ROSI